MTVKVQLAKRHTHNRMVCEAGDVIEVSERDAEWLKSIGVVQQFNKRWQPPVPTEETDE